ncbi:neuroendocrine convertase 1-like [Anabrus simplex]|uniref:neuroendocrine convertase 1-like n=1 Tax=Anabrus simplex TaxID=316456 RepID=UPI0035A33FDC
MGIWAYVESGKQGETPLRFTENFAPRLQKKISTVEPVVGRGGKGAIFVWASGNGGSRGDNCNCDGYIASVYTLSVGSASQHGQFPWYGERCASTFAATYSSGAYSDQMIATTDLRNSCTIKHTGTSASAPLAAGIIALALEVNPQLTWRDVQHLVMWTSEYTPLSDNEGWIRNAAGAWVNTRFGFGLMNAYGLVSAAANWTNVPPKSICTVPAESRGNVTFRHGEQVSLYFLTDGCYATENEVKYLEHVEVLVNIHYSFRGALEIYLTSGAGTRVQLLGPRKLDDSDKGFVNWKFMSVLTWGENPTGIWMLEISDKTGSASNHGWIGECSLLLHGTKHRPAHLAGGPRKYNIDYNRVHKKMVTPSENGPSTLDALREVKGSSQLEWTDLVGSSLALRQSEMTSSRRTWIEEILEMMNTM